MGQLSPRIVTIEPVHSGALVLQTTEPTRHDLTEACVPQLKNHLLQQEKPTYHPEDSAQPEKGMT